MTTLAEALAPKSDQLNADDLIPGPRTLKITGARISKEDRQTRIILNYEGDNGKPWKPCKTMGRAMVMVWAVTDEAQMVGKSIRVYRDPEVRFGDQGQVGGIRISHMSDIDKPASVKLTVSQGKKSVFTFHPLLKDAGTPAASEDMSIDDVRTAIETAPTLKDLERIWLSKTTRPYRDQLKGELDDRKAALSFNAEGPSDSQRGESHTNSDADDLIDLIKEADADALDGYEQAYLDGGRNSFETPDQDRIETAIAEAKARLKGGK